VSRNAKQVSLAAKRLAHTARRFPANLTRENHAARGLFSPAEEAVMKMQGRFTEDGSTL